MFFKCDLFFGIVEFCLVYWHVLPYFIVLGIFKKKKKEKKNYIGSTKVILPMSDSDESPSVAGVVKKMAWAENRPKQKDAAY